jgi:hypothetical protein
MRPGIRITQFIVGILFILSGLIKANDPLGLSYKMQEFFELWSAAFSKNGFGNGLRSILDYFHQHSLLLAVIMISLEVIAGLALLLAWHKKLVTISLLVLILFFTWLTGYAYLSGKFTNCGCFGDCFPISPLTSFIKDLILLVLILLLVSSYRYLYPIIKSSTTTTNTVLIAGIVFTVGIQLYILNYLPVADCLPFKKGNNISQQMKPPVNSVPDSFAIKFIYEKNGKQYQFSPEQLPADFSTYKFIERKQELVRKGNADPPIKGFSLTGLSGTDSTEQVLQDTTCILFFLQDYEHQEVWLQSFKTLVNTAAKTNVPVYVVTSDVQQIVSKLSFEKINVPVFACDFTVIRTASRTTPEIYFLNKGTIIDKYSYRKMNKAIQRLNQ